MTIGPEPASETPRSWRVVIVDDNPDDRVEIRRLLLKGSDRRCKFEEAELGASAVCLCRRSPSAPPDCVILDYNLPDMDATEVLAELSDGGGLPICPVVVLTGSAAPDVGRTILRAGAQDYLGKGWMTAESLTRAIENAHERWIMALELRDRETRLGESERRLDRALQAARAGTWALNLATGEFSASARALTLYGMPADATLDFAGAMACIHPDDRPRVENAIRQAAAAGEPFRVEYRPIRPGSAECWVLLQGEAQPYADGPRLAGLVQDVTERKRYERALADQDKRKDEFLATLAHELRNPLAPIQNGLQIIRLSGTANPAVIKARTMMERQLGHLVHLVDDLLDISRINQGKIPLRRERMTVQEATESAIEACRPTVDAKRHALATNLTPEPLVVNGDRTRLVQVLSNLITNAAKYSEPGGRIAIAARRSGTEAVVTVADQGVGIAPEALSTLWDMFAQVRDTLDKAQGGLGIGLSLVKKLVEMHGGTVSAESPGVGQGSTFIIRLPLEISTQQAGEAEHSPIAKHEPQTSSQSPSQPSRRVLVVDDNRDGAESLALMVKIFGNQTAVAYDGPDALKVARTFRPDVIFLDIGLPGLDGYEVARRLRADPDTANAALIALTGWGSEEDKRRSQDAGFDRHLTKPVEAAAVRDALSRPWQQATGGEVAEKHAPLRQKQRGELNLSRPTE